MRKNLLFLAVSLFANIGLANAQRPISNFSEDFEDGTLGIMTTIDADGDGHNWMNSSALQVQGDGHNGSARYAYSESWASALKTNRWGLYPDNFLVSPLVAIDETSVFTFYVCLDWYVYPGEHYGVAISTASNTNPDDFTTIAEWDLNDKGTRDDDQGPWHEHNIDLSQYAGQNVYIAIRHFYCSNIYLIDLDDVSLTSQAGGSCEAPTNFTGELKESTITLDWNATESAVSYKIYRSNTGENYETIGTVSVNRFEENITENSTYYYKVTAIYADGCESSPATTAEGESFLMFEVGDLNVSESGLNASLYPNPSNGSFFISCENMTRISVYGMRGETIMDVNTEADNYTISDLGTGVYFVRIETATSSMTQKIVRL